MPLDLRDKRASSDQPIAGGKPTSHLLIRGSGLDYFRVADHPEADRFLRRYSVQAGAIQLPAT
jgi:hypothetical protein